MSIADLFRSKGTLRGTLLMRGLPRHKALRVDVTFFRVSSASAPLPFNGEPPPKAYRDTVVVKETEAPEGMPLRFEILRPVGFYYVDVGVIAFREVDGRLLAQVEHFFPLDHPSEITASKVEDVELSFHWPEIPVDQLHKYGTVYPQGSGPASA